MDRRRNTKEASKYLQKRWKVKRTPGTLEVLRSRGRGPAFVRVGRNILYLQSRLDTYGRGVQVKTVDSLRPEVKKEAQQKIKPQQRDLPGFGTKERISKNNPNYGEL